MEHEQEKNAAREKQIATLDKIETALEDLSKLLQARGARTPWHAHRLVIPGMLLLQALTAEKKLALDEQLIQVIEKRLALLRESLGE